MQMRRRFVYITIMVVIMVFEYIIFTDKPIDRKTGYFDNL